MNIMVGILGRSIWPRFGMEASTKAELATQRLKERMRRDEAKVQDPIRKEPKPKAKVQFIAEEFIWKEENWDRVKSLMRVTRDELMDIHGRLETGGCTQFAKWWSAFSDA